MSGGRTALAQGASGDDDPLEALRELVAIRAETDRRETVLIRRARHAGSSWAQIAAALGVSKQAVHKKYAGRGGRA